MGVKKCLWRKDELRGWEWKVWPVLSEEEEEEEEKEGVGELGYVERCCESGFNSSRSRSIRVWAGRSSLKCCPARPEKQEERLPRNKNKCSTMLSSALFIVSYNICTHKQHTHKHAHIHMHIFTCISFPCVFLIPIQERLSQFPPIIYSSTVCVCVLCVLRTIKIGANTLEYESESAGGRSRIDEGAKNIPHIHVCRYAEDKNWRETASRCQWQTE